MVIFPHQRLHFGTDKSHQYNTGVRCTMVHVACVYMSSGSRESIDLDLLERDDMYMQCMLHESLYSQYIFWLDIVVEKILCRESGFYCDPSTWLMHGGFVPACCTSVAKPLLLHLITVLMKDAPQMRVLHAADFCLKSSRGRQTSSADVCAITEISGRQKLALDTFPVSGVGRRSSSYPTSSQPRQIQPQ